MSIQGTSLSVIFHETGLKKDISWLKMLKKRQKSVKNFKLSLLTEVCCWLLLKLPIPNRESEKNSKDFNKIFCEDYDMFLCWFGLGNGSLCQIQSSVVITWSSTLYDVQHAAIERELRGWTYKRHPIPRPDRQAMGCLLWGFGQKLTAL